MVKALVGNCRIVIQGKPHELEKGKEVHLSPEELAQVPTGYFGVEPSEKPKPIKVK